MSTTQSSQPTRENSVDANSTVTKGKLRKRTSFLTDEQKKRHHIESEHKRRQAIREAFVRLTELVPTLAPSDARSEILVLDQSTEYLIKLYRENIRLVKTLEERGTPVLASHKIPFPNGEPPESERYADE